MTTESEGIALPYGGLMKGLNEKECHKYLGILQADHI